MVFSRQVNVDTHPVVFLNQLKSLFIEIPQQHTTVVKVVKNAEFHRDISVMSLGNIAQHSHATVSVIYGTRRLVETLARPWHEPHLGMELHGMAGALGAVQINALASAFVELECRLTGMAVTPALAVAVRQNLTRLQDLLDSLK